MSQQPNISVARDIDFLPAHYREQDSKRTVHRWRFIVMAFFAAIFPALSLYQYQIRSDVYEQASKLRVRYNKAKIDELRLRRLEAELVAANAKAELHTFLRHPWPATQILAAATRSLPETIALTELTMQARSVDEESQRPARRPNASSTTDKAEAESALPAAGRDLETLRKETRSRQWVISLAGETLNTSDLYAYINQLGKEPIFERAELDSVEAPQGSAQQTAKFRARIMVIQAYGQPGGPNGNNGPQSAAISVSRVPTDRTDAAMLGASFSPRRAAP